MPLPDVVIPVRMGDDNEELRYALRSLALNMPHRAVWLVGFLPSWVSDQVGYIPVEQTSTKWANTRANLIAACTDPDVPDEFILSNDDMFCMRPVEQVPVLHRGRVDDVVRRFGERGIDSRYVVGMRDTATYLREMHGIDEPLSYELHIPMLVNKRTRLEALYLAEESGIKVPHVRTIYGNLQQLGGEQIEDVKYHTFEDVPADDAVWVSTDDGPFNRGAVGAWIRERLPDPCRYELDGDEEAAA